MLHFHLKKMKTELNDIVHYNLVDREKSIFMNDIIGKKLKIRFTGKINCIKCGAETKKSFGQGFCYRCFTSAPEADVCVVHPERCRANEGISRDMEWSEKHCLRPHYVYLAKTSVIKVGVTRQSQIPVRWIDQGADKAIKLAKTPYRQLAGIIEVALKEYFTDKTSWQSMLKNKKTDESLIESKKQAVDFLKDNEDYKKFIVPNNKIFEIKYPHKQNPKKIKSLKLDKISNIEGILTGIKGQYLIFDNEYVFNVRAHTGYNIELEY